jgi:hypothetical protein
MQGPARYPDISDIITRKAKGRLERARLSFGAKLDILDKLRSDVAPIVEARRVRLEQSKQRLRGAAPKR